MGTEPGRRGVTAAAAGDGKSRGKAWGMASIAHGRSVRRSIGIRGTDVTMRLIVIPRRGFVTGVHA